MTLPACLPDIWRAWHTNYQTIQPQKDQQIYSSFLQIGINQVKCWWAHIFNQKTDVTGCHKSPPCMYVPWMFKNHSRAMNPPARTAAQTAVWRQGNTKSEVQGPNRTLNLNYPALMWGEEWCPGGIRRLRVQSLFQNQKRWRINYMSKHFSLTWKQAVNAGYQTRKESTNQTSLVTRCEACKWDFQKRRCCVRVHILIPYR